MRGARYVYHLLYYLFSTFFKLMHFLFVNLFEKETIINEKPVSVGLSRSYKITMM